MAANAVAVRQIGQLELLPGYSQALEIIEQASRVDEAKAIRDKAAAFQAYAIKAKNRDMEYFAAEIRMRSERRAGELLIEARANKTRRVKGQSHVPEGNMMLPTLEELGITRKEAAAWQRVAKLSAHDFELRLARMRAEGKPGSLDAMFSSDSDEWMTPKEILDSVIAVLGEIYLDPCAERSDAQANVSAKYHFTKKHDGLLQPWEGTVFMNPPYSEAASFVEKFIASWKEGPVTQAVALLPSRTDQKWFQDLHEVAPVCFVRGRIMFKRASGELDTTSAPFPSAVFYLGPRIDRFTAEFEGRYGQISQVRS